MAQRVLNELLEKEMDRREFLKHAGAAVIAVIGLAGALSAFKEIDHKQRVSGYGGSVYGGHKDNVQG